MSSSPDPGAPPRRSLRRRVLRWACLGLLGFVVCVAAYALAAWVLGRVPVNADWRNTPGGHPVYVRSNGVHTDIALPAVVGERDLRVEYPLTSGDTWARWVAFGWGDEGFYLGVPTWSELTVSAAVRATLLPSPTLMHVTHWYRPPEEGERCKRLLVTDEELARLLAWVDAHFVRRPDGTAVRLEGAGYEPKPGYLHNNEFFEAEGSYHLFNTCNDWANGALHHAGIRAPLWSPFDGAIFRQLEGR